MRLIKLMRAEPEFGGNPNHRVLPDDYLAAAVECLALMFVQAWILAYFFSYDNILSNPLKDRVGYNNPCVAWDVPPALYTSAFLMFIPVYLVVRFVFLGMERMALDSSISTLRKRFVFIWEALFAASVVGMPMIFIFTPDRHPVAHTMVFSNYIVFSLLGIGAQWLEKPAEVAVSSWVFLAVYALVSIAYIVNIGVSFYREAPFFPWQLGWAVDISWFLCLPLLSYFMPRQGWLLVSTAFLPESGDQTKLMDGESRALVLS